MILRSRTNIDHKGQRESERAREGRKGTNRFNIDITFYATHFFSRLSAAAGTAAVASFSGIPCMPLAFCLSLAVR